MLHIFFGNRVKSGFTYGVITTLAMTLVMLLGMISGMNPIPEPIPVALIKSLLGTLSQPLLMILAMGSHFLYGGLMGLLLFQMARGHNLFWQGLAWGFFLWLIMHLVVLPFIGWGFFAGAMNTKIIPATLLLHLIYGSILGGGLLKEHSLLASG